MGELKKLRVLDLEENRLELLPNEIGKFVSILFVFCFFFVAVFVVVLIIVLSINLQLSV